MKLNEAITQRLNELLQVKGMTQYQLHEMLCAWRQAAAMLKAGEITQEEYTRWRYRYPEFDTTQRWAKVSSQMLSDMLVDALNEVED